MKNSLFKLTKIAALGLMLSSGVAFANINETYKTMSIQKVTKLSNQGDFRALAELGSRYYEGKDVAKDKVKALELFEKAAKMGSTRGQNAIGLIHIDNKDYGKAKVWFEKAINNPNNDDIQRKASAYNNLAILYRDGNGVTKDLDKAFELVSQSENLYPNIGSKLDIGWIYQQKKDYAQAKVWYEKVINNPAKNENLNKAKAYSNLANFYAKGLGVEKNLDTALELNLQAENIYPRIWTQLDIGWVYNQKGEYQNAIEWYQKAINNPSKDNDNGKGKASYQLGLLYRDGKGVSTDINKALELFLKANQLIPAAKDIKQSIAEIYEEKGNSEKATEWRAKIK